MAKKNTKTGVNRVGRPNKVNTEILDKLREGFLTGYDRTEACAYAKLPLSTFYDYIKEHPEFSDEIEEWIQNPILKAKATLFKNLDDPKHAKWYLSRKKKDEFSERTEVTGADGKDLTGLVQVNENNQSIKVADDSKKRQTQV